MFVDSSFLLSPFLKSFLKIYLFLERACVCELGEGQRERIFHADSPLSEEPDVGLSLTTHEIMTPTLN